MVPRVPPWTTADSSSARWPSPAAIASRAWQSAYRGLIPQSYLDAMSVARDADRHRTRFGQGDGSVVNARRFYERAGFEADGTEEPFEADGVPVPGVRYARTLNA